MNRRLALILLGAVLFAGCGQRKPEVTQDSGQAIYLARCAVCHGEKGEGKPGCYPPLTGSEWVIGPPERLAAIILDGVRGRIGDQVAVMPGWSAVLRDSEIAAVMTWLRKKEGKSLVTAVEAHHTRIRTAGRNTFWTAEDLRSLNLRHLQPPN